MLLGSISHGLRALYTVSFCMQDHEQLVATMQRIMCYPESYDLEEELRETSQYSRRQYHLSDRDQKQERREPLRFRGDGEPDAEGTRPPLAWTIIWRGTYSNRYGECIPKEMVRWGYVIWDAARLESTGARGLLERLLEEDHRGLDLDFEIA